MTTHNSQSPLALFANEAVTRRSALKVSGMGAAALAVGIPVGLSLFASSAEAQASANANLVAALRLKRFAKALYEQIPADAEDSAQTILTDMLAHETAHITTLTGLVTGAPAAPASYDFTAGGYFDITDGAAGVGTFFDLARYVEDLSVRILKGAIPGLFGDATKVTQIMAMHTVDARHAAITRIYKKGYNAASTSSTATISYYALITGGTDDYGNAPSDGEAPEWESGEEDTYLSHYVYGPRQGTADNFNTSEGEDNQMQNGTRLSTHYVTDEPCSAAAVDKFLEPFTV